MRGRFALFFPRSKVSVMFSVLILAVLLGALAVTGAFLTQSSRAVSPGDWPTYLFNNKHTGFNGSETIINSTSAPNLKLKWTTQTKGCSGSPGTPPTISTQPVVVQALQLIFWGSWDGCEHASDLSGNEVWATYIGQTNNPNCKGLPILGVTSTATVISEMIGGTSTPVVLVGGGDVNFYALNALTGAVIWKTLLGSATGSFIWGSPAIYRGSVYIGLSSQDDCPLVQGGFFQISALTGVIQHTFEVVPNGCIGGSVWGSAAIDQAAGTVYFGTGNPGNCSQPEPYAVSLIELRVSDLTFIGSWQVPASEQIFDSDFGNTPTLFKAKIGGVVQQLVGIENKNGIYYALARGNLSNGPVWQANIAVPQTGGRGNFSPSAWDGTKLYVAGGFANISGTLCDGTNKKGSLSALNPANGTFLWRDCFPSGNVPGAVTAVPGVAVVGAGPDIEVVGTASGKILFTYKDTSTGARFVDGASISNGVLYMGDTNGFLYAIAP